tara:strand:- start:489 stop:803 length:315 start_codon:yes stop_codon:yes gene_type:complete
MNSEYKNISRSLAESAASVLKGETLNELTDAQKKLPAGLQKAIAKKDGDKKDDDKKEELSPAQKKMDKNDNGKIDGEDLAKLRAKKEELELVIAELESKNENAE